MIILVTICTSQKLHFHLTNGVKLVVSPHAQKNTSFDSESKVSLIVMSPY